MCTPVFLHNNNMRSCVKCFMPGIHMDKIEHNFHKSLICNIPKPVHYHYVFAVAQLVQVGVGGPSDHEHVNPFASAPGGRKATGKRGI